MRATKHSAFAAPEAMGLSSVSSSVAAEAFAADAKWQVRLARVVELHTMVRKYKVPVLLHYFSYICSIGIICWLWKTYSNRKTTEYAIWSRAIVIKRSILDDRYCEGKHNGRRCGKQFAKKMSFSDTCFQNTDPNRAPKRSNVTPWVTLGEFQFTSNDYIDIIVYDIFFRQKNRTDMRYVEVGASNGISASNSFFFDECLAWKGLLIEATQCAHCILPYNRPGALIEHAAIGVEGDVFYPSSMQAFCSGQHPDCVAIGKILSPVPCKQLKTIFHVHHIDHIDFLSIDIESQSEIALQSIDFNRVNISVIVVECRQVSWCIQFLKTKGYSSVQISELDVLGWHPGALKR